MTRMMRAMAAMRVLRLMRGMCTVRAGSGRRQLSRLVLAALFAAGQQHNPGYHFAAF